MRSNKPDFIALVFAGIFSLALAACDVHSQTVASERTPAFPSAGALNEPAVSPSIPAADDVSTSGATPDPDSDSTVLNKIQERGGGSLAAPRRAMAYTGNPKEAAVVVPPRRVPSTGVRTGVITSTSGVPGTGIFAFDRRSTTVAN